MGKARTRIIDPRRSLLSVAFGAVVLTAGGFAAAGQKPRAAEPSWALADFVNDARVTQKLPGLAIIVVHSDGPPQVFVSGERRIGKGDPITPADRMHLGSNTKAITATVIGALVEQGRTTFDTTIGETFPELVPTMRPAYRGVTVRQLLSHAGGIQPYRKRGSLHWTLSLKGTQTDQQRTFIEHVLAEKPRFEPGAKHDYSNAGAAIAGAMAERIAGRSYRQLVEDLVFAPLGGHAAFGNPGLDAALQPWGHVRMLFGKVTEVAPADEHYTTPPVIESAAGVSLSLENYGRFLQLHLRGLRGRDDGLKAATIQELHKTVLPADTALGWAMGWVIITANGIESHQHAGSIGAYIAQATILSSRDLAFAIMTNIGGGKDIEEALANLGPLIAARAAGSRNAG